MIQDGALLLSDSWNISTVVKHGWEILSGPYIANQTDKTVLHSMDYRDAFNVYKEVVEKDSGQTFKDDNFFDLAKSYPLGIANLGTEILVRDPIARKDGSLLLVGEMDNNSVVYILKGNKDKLIDSARSAAEEALSSQTAPRSMLIVDCISRVLFLEDDFQEELQAISQNITSQDVSIFGVLSLGEIANTNRDYIDFYNKTCVIGVI